MRRKKILLVEDAEDLRTLLKEALELFGHEVVEAGNGAEALEALRSTMAPPSLILLDLMMPVMDGWTFLTELGEDPALAGRGIPVVVLSAALEGVPGGYVEFLRKPVELDALIKAVERHGG